MNQIKEVVEQKGTKQTCFEKKFIEIEKAVEDFKEYKIRRREKIKERRLTRKYFNNYD